MHTLSVSKKKREIELHGNPYVGVEIRRLFFTFSFAFLLFLLLLFGRTSLLLLFQ